MATDLIHSPGNVIKKKSCILFIGKKEGLNASAVLFARQIFDIKALIRHDDALPDDSMLMKLQPDIVISFLNEKILQGAWLQCRNVNFHPAPPEWPGRGSASLAIFHGSEIYGATAHEMRSAVDSGTILAVRRFPIPPGETCESLFARAEHACLELFFEIGTYFAMQGELPEAAKETWQRKAMSRKQFSEWLILDQEDKDTFERKIKASQHSSFPGPYVIIHGYKFGLVDD